MKGVIHIKPSATVAECFWFDVFVNGEHVAQTCKETELEGIENVRKQVKHLMPNVTRFTVKHPGQPEQPAY